MRKKYLVMGLMIAVLPLRAQRMDTAYQAKRVARTEVQVLYAHYVQDGVHSAVTGGTGTEKLAVYSPELVIRHQPDSSHAFQLEGGVDVITSASTDKIDFVVSSASRKDGRTHANIGYTYQTRSHRMEFGGNTGFSIESDYFSLGGGLSASYTRPDQSRSLSVEVQGYSDDLRWGRLNPGYHRPVKLIYPQELRTQEWYPTTRRHSLNLSLSLYQTINKRMALGLYPGITWQQGLLATPFHRVYFADQTTLKVENLPGTRLKIPLGVQLNVFPGRIWILRAGYRLYWDDFGIWAHTFSLTTPIKLTPSLTLTPHVRVYTQTAARYFRPYQAHDPASEYYTSDYDLSAFTSWQAGAGGRWLLAGRLPMLPALHDLQWRYSYYHRADGLHAHMVSLIIGYATEKTKTRRTTPFIQSAPHP
ncbi:MAG: DUF3570 domain-containing protein [Bacteroidia bacterium]|nr:DUF3570 domain-containing protein [Bacteroidia bacterium]